MASYGGVVTADFAHDLERRLALMTAERDGLKAAADEIERQRVARAPETLHDLPDYGDHLPLSEFGNWYSGGDGTAYYATETQYSHMHVRIKLKAPEWATHFIYFGK